MKILVTGGAGFIGSHVVEKHSLAGDDVVVVDDLSMGNLENINGFDNVTFYNESISNFNFMDGLLIKEKFDVIYLLAAIASVADTINRPYESHRVNQEANIHILETIRTQKLNIKRLLFSSSAAVYGTLPDLPKNEMMAVSPATAYAIDKYATERFVLSYAKLYHVPAVAVRFFNVYGPRQNPSSPYSGVLSIISNSLVSNKPFKIFGDGQQTRDFVFVNDVVNALWLAESNPDMIGEVFNVASGKTHTLLQAIEMLEKASGKKLDYVFGDERVGDIHDSAADISKLESVGFKATYTFDQGISAYWESLK